LEALTDKATTVREYENSRNSVRAELVY